jgi:hypothetical protein
VRKRGRGGRDSIALWSCRCAWPPNTHNQATFPKLASKVTSLVRAPKTGLDLTLCKPIFIQTRNNRTRSKQVSVAHVWCGPHLSHGVSCSAELRRLLCGIPLCAVRWCAIIVSVLFFLFFDLGERKLTSSKRTNPRPTAPRHATTHHRDRPRVNSSTR